MSGVNDIDQDSDVLIERVNACRVAVASKWPKL